MYLATGAGLMIPPISRLPPPVELVALLVLIFSGPVYDKLRHSSVHRVYMWGIPFGIAATVIQSLIASTGLWMRFASWLTR